MKKELITITKLVANPDGSIFGFALTENGDGVFLPTTSLRKREVSTGEIYQALVEPNTKNISNTPWYSLGIITEEQHEELLDDDDDEDDEDEDDDDLVSALPSKRFAPVESLVDTLDNAVIRQMCLSTLNRADRPMTARQIGMAIGIDGHKAQTNCKVLHERGEIAAVSVARNRKKKASFVAYLSLDIIKSTFDEIIMFDHEVEEQFGKAK